MITVGIFSLSGCSGCQIEFLNIENKMLDIIKNLKIVEAQIIKTGVFPGDLDISFIEGSAVKSEEVERLIKIRKRSKKLVALGTCASYGGIQSLVRTIKMKEALRLQYKGQVPVISFPPKGIDNWVDVDYKLYGCPVERHEILSLIINVLLGKEYRNIDYSVCTECILRENDCLLDKGEPCMGPVTRGGCNARCPHEGMYCTSCRGGYEDQNISAHITKLKELSFTDEEIKRFYNKYYRRLDSEG